MNNQSVARKLIDCLDREFDLPFTIDVINGAKETRFRLYPSNDDESLFEAEIFVRDNIRYNASLKPQNYGRDFVSTMEKADEDMESMFSYIVRGLIDDGCKIAVELNGQRVDEKNIYSWPEHWDKIEISVTKSPFFYLDGTEEESNAFVDLTIKIISLFLSLVPIEKVEKRDTLLTEGDEKLVQGKRYERNPVARKICIEEHGCRCAVCGFDFEEQYGLIGRGYIEVHHIVPVSSIGYEYTIDPEKDLIPLCSNCHSMIHRRNPPFLPDELKKIKDSVVEVS